MKLAIVGYGDPVLKKVAKSISPDYPALPLLIENMFETMYAASGVGLAAPQIGLPIRLFIVDASPFAEEDENLANFKKIFINAEIIEESGEAYNFSEGCLSIPDIREEVSRKPNIKIKYQDENFNTYIEEFSGFAARVIQHEYDHIEGKLFIERLSILRKSMIQGKLNAIIKGQVKVDYKMKFAKSGKKR